MVDKTPDLPQSEVDKMARTLIRMGENQERERFDDWVETACPFDGNVGMVERGMKTSAAWQGWQARAALEDFRCNAVVQRDMESLAMMLRMCAYRLRRHGHQDLSDKTVDLLRRMGLQGSPLRSGAESAP